MRKVLFLTVMCLALIGSVSAQFSVSGTIVSETDGLGATWGDRTGKGNHERNAHRF